MNAREAAASLPRNGTGNAPQLALGTVQFGLPYGIAGRGDAVPEPEVRTILEDAADRGLRWLDTAAAYGDIEERLARLTHGLDFHVVSKVPALPAALSAQEAVGFALDAARRSQRRLDTGLRALLMHSGTDLHGARGKAVADALRAWCRSQDIAFGASCYAPEEAAALRADHDIAMTQLPGSAFDQRVDAAGRAGILQGLDVHLRSAFLQGLLLMPEAQARERLPAAAAALTRWHAHCRDAGVEPLAAALSVVKSFAGVAVVVVGVDDLAQWTGIADAWSDAAAQPAPGLAETATDLIDPRCWRIAP